MGRCSIQIVVGPAGSGKSTYCHVMQDHAYNLSAGIRRHRRIHVINMDPAAEIFSYDCCLDVRELISVQEVMQELGLGPNGALVYSMEYVLEHAHDWLHDALDDFDEDETVLLDCPGQVELYTHVPVLRSLMDSLKLWGYEGHLVTVFCVDASFLTADVTKFLSGSLLALSAMIALELPHVNVLTKADLVPEPQIESILSQSPLELVEHNSTTNVYSPPFYDNRDFDDEAGEQQEQQQHSNDYRRFNPNNLEYQYPRIPSQRNENNNTSNGHRTADDSRPEQEEPGPSSESTSASPLRRTTRRRRIETSRLTNALCQLLDDYSMVSFIPLNIREEESIEHVLATVDHAIQFGEDLEVRAGGGDSDDDYDHHDHDTGGGHDHNGDNDNYGGD